MNILAIGAHYDDIELGCGGALARHVAQGDTVYAFVATDSGYSNQNKESVRSSDVALKEAKAAMKVLGVKKMFCGDFKTLEVEFVDALNVQILKIIEECNIEQVYAHWTGDIHHDHRSVARASLHSCRHVPRYLMYCSNWYHSTDSFRGNFYVDISDTIELKEQAVRAHESEVQRTGEKWLTFFRHEAANAGQRIGVPYAEAFEVVKWLVSK